MAANQMSADGDEFVAERARAGARDVVSAWVIAILLIAGAVISVTLDHIITVSPDPPATYHAAREAIAAEEEAAADPGVYQRELHDLSGP